MGESVVVTGASAGIGAGCVEVYRDAGWEVIGVDRHESSPAERHLQLDLSSPNCGDELLRYLDGEPVTGLVNSAGIALDKAATEVTATDFDHVYRVNLRAPLLLSAALKPSLSVRNGFVVNVASVHAVATSRNVSGYAATKGGLVAMSKALAVEWAPDIRVNVVLPGAIDTEMLQEGLRRGGTTLDGISAKTPLARVGDPLEVARAILFLSENRFLTGSSLVVDGGAIAHLSTE